MAIAAEVAVYEAAKGWSNLAPVAVLQIVGGGGAG